MAVVKLVKSIYTGSDVTSLGEIASGDTFDIPSGSTLNTPTSVTLTNATGLPLTTGVTGTLPVANGGTNNTAFTAKSGNVAGLVFFDGTKLANDSTVTDVGYDTSTNTLTAKNLSLGGLYTEGVVSIGTVTSSSTLSLATGTVQTATLTASTACTFTMPTAVAGQSFILLLKQAASTGNGTATFTSVKWATAGAPTITATAGKMDILTFVSDGTNWYGSYTQGYTP